MERMREILTFWFGKPDDPLGYDESRMDLWFRSGCRDDAIVRARFGADLDRAGAGELDTWLETPQGTLALIIVLDQFSRHVHRGTPGAFARDARAQSIVLEAVAGGVDRELRPIERAFLYLPLEHAEDRELQRQSVALHERLLANLPPRYRERYRSFLEHARQHRNVVERFGRFPHRNAILGRESTVEETAFLEQGRSSRG
ncbi:MAG: DUF924 domain-containing protein [Gammaproteobacteria bacterium]|nr:DUF924 domain-containing protein [Gammaproteobacteria bacterium]NIR84589.1 DUF924 domain-containing protein [Gammaproteobacteria bacterium]NIR90492.1 DUF924 domain-containing protein [Gammaproteobacteria bacterium]NIU05640.1 DUF924 domain-containing protein [Gammaproteobacteria bacterium]NIV52779.1 DUF924 family protein [Gammaproteobacteria bacterium]